MSVVLLMVGSRGHVQPFLALALGLQRVGHNVRVATHAQCESFVGSRGLDFAPAAANPLALQPSDAGQGRLRDEDEVIVAVKAFEDHLAQASVRLD